VSYLGELRTNARPLLAASLGVGTSLPFDAYTNSIFARYLIQEFHWSRAQFALYGQGDGQFLALSLPCIRHRSDRQSAFPASPQVSCLREGWIV
jgi:hypothetical protein